MNTDVRTISLSSIVANPWQPRTVFRPEDLEDLVNSVKQHGLLQPLVVVETSNGRYQLIAGERRLRAAKAAGLASVPVVVRTATDEQQLELALVENIQRQDLNPLERARGYERLMKRFGMTQEQVAKKLAKSRTAVANSLRLLALPEPIQKAISEGRLTEGHAKVIAGLEGRDVQLRFFERVVQTQASVRETEVAAKQISKRKPTVVSSHLRGGTSAGTYDAERRILEQAFGTKVEITRKADGGTVTVHFYNEEDLQEIVRKVSD